MNSDEYPFIKLPYKEYGSMTHLCCYINRRISARENCAFHFNYFMEYGKISISSPINSEKIILNDSMRDVLGFKQSIINGRSTGSTSGMDCAGQLPPPGFSSDNCIFLYASLVETSRIGNTNVSLLHILERKTTHEHIHHYNIRNLQYIPVNTSFLELCQLTLRSELGDPLAITKGLAVM